MALVSIKFLCLQALYEIRILFGKTTQVKYRGKFLESQCEKFQIIFLKHLLVIASLNVSAYICIIIVTFSSCNPNVM